jgi:hypothetical protein
MYVYCVYICAGLQNAQTDAVQQMQNTLDQLHAEQEHVEKCQRDQREELERQVYHTMEVVTQHKYVWFVFSLVFSRVFMPMMMWALSLSLSLFCSVALGFVGLKCLNTSFSSSL